MAEFTTGFVKNAIVSSGMIFADDPDEPFAELFEQWLAGVKANVWDEAIATSRSILERRSPAHYETDIDLIVEPNPYRSGDGK